MCGQALPMTGCASNFIGADDAGFFAPYPDFSAAPSRQSAQFTNPGTRNQDWNPGLQLHSAMLDVVRRVLQNPD